MDEQGKQLSNTQHNESGEENKRRGSRRRNRRKRNQGSAPESQVPQVQQAEESGNRSRQAEPERPRTGNAAKPKRRNAPRRTAMPDISGPAEVVRATAPQIAPLQPMRMHKIDAADNSEPIIGCPMLTRTRLEIPFRGNQRVARCSVGWAIHDEDEVLMCQHTETAAQCWKEDSQHLEALVERLRPIIEAELSATD